MGHRTHLAVRQSSFVHLNLFETNNTLAIFWLTLLSTDDVARIGREWKRLEQAEECDEDEVEVDFDQFDPNYETALETDWIVLDARTALLRAKGRRLAIAQFLPKHRKLFDDWLAYLTSRTGNSWQLVLDIWQYANFSDTDAFITTLLSDINSLDNPMTGCSLLSELADEPDYLTGWECWSTQMAFTKRSSAYRQLNEVAKQTKKSQLADREQSAEGLSIVPGLLFRLAYMGTAFYFFPSGATIVVVGLAMVVIDLLVAFDVITKPAIVRKLFKWKD